jgi:hypothetical protein
MEAVAQRSARVVRGAAVASPVRVYARRQVQTSHTILKVLQIYHKHRET